MSIHIAFDAAERPGALARLRLSGELAKIKVSLNTAGAGPAAILQRLKLTARANQIRVELGGDTQDVSAPGDGEWSDDPNSQNYRYRDTGYIADSRKERAASLIRDARKTGQRVRATDIDFEAIEQNPREAREIVVKANLFGKTDWQALQDAGMEPAAGFLIEKVYASIAPEPSQDSPEVRHDYVVGLESIRDRLQEQRTVDGVLGVIVDIRDELDGVTLRPDEAERYTALNAQIRELAAQERALDSGSRAIHDQVGVASSELMSAQRVIEQRKRRGWQVTAEHQRAVDEARAKSEALWAQFGVAVREESSRRTELHEQWKELRGQRDTLVKLAKQRNLTENQATRSWLTFGERFMRLINYRSFKGSDSFAGHVTNAKTGKINDWSWADKERPNTPKGATQREIAFQLRVADAFERVGGASVSVASTQALKDLLGLRDVQSGNWVLKDPNSAKFHVEQTAAAMSDLADVLGIDVVTLGLGGRLGLAFGARGTGGKNAPRAHYESVHRVINLTKMGGGGSLGHEMFHAIDNILHELVKQEVSGARDEFVTETPDLLPAGAIRDAVRELHDALLSGDTRLSERIEFTERDVETAKFNLDNPRNAIAREIRDAGSAEAAVLAVDKRMSGLKTRKSQKILNDWRKIAVAFYAKKGETFADLRTGSAMSNFAASAAALDDGSLGKYWSRPREMAARAFQAWLEDTLSSQGRRNDYLSVFANNEFYRDPLAGIAGKPFPEGDERERINAAFERLFEAIRAAKVFENAMADEGLLDSIFGGAQ